MKDRDSFGYSLPGALQVVSERGFLCEWVVTHYDIMHMLDTVSVHHLNIMGMIRRMRVWGSILMEMIIIAILNNLSAKVPLLWTRFVMFTVTTGIIMLLVFH
uniref:Uncharacterized protein n=1 Tax=Oryza barthii TaxID=65489 RepID=A0A0D3FS96_9ORYZ